MEVVIVIDGTGPICDQEYKRQFANSFCKRISKMSNNATYFRGVPGEEGEYLKSLIVSIDDQVEDLSRRAGHLAQLHVQRHTRLWGQLARELPIYLVGYSRGGLCCVELAEMLQEYDLNVEAMYLFDAVNMTYPSGRGRVIPKNVKRCYHAMRDPAFFMKYLNKYWKLISENSILNQRQGVRLYTGDEKERDLALRRLDLTRSNIRSPFFNWGNCAVEHEADDSRLVKEKFMGSHGALGGVPWDSKIFPEDAECERKVEAWMWKQLQPWGEERRRIIEAARRLLQTA